MKLRKKKGEDQDSGPPEPPTTDLTPLLYMLEAVRLAILATGAGSGTQDSIRLRGASDHIAERVMSCQTVASN